MIVMKASAFTYSQGDGLLPNCNLEEIYLVGKIRFLSDDPSRADSPLRGPS